MLPPRFIVTEIPADGAKPEVIIVADSLADLCNRAEALGIAEARAKELAADVLRTAPNPHQGPPLAPAPGPTVLPFVGEMLRARNRQRIRRAIEEIARAEGYAVDATGDGGPLVIDVQ